MKQSVLNAQTLQWCQCYFFRVQVVFQYCHCTKELISGSSGDHGSTHRSRFQALIEFLVRNYAWNFRFGLNLCTLRKLVSTNIPAERFRYLSGHLLGTYCSTRQVISCARNTGLGRRIFNAFSLWQKKLATFQRGVELFLCPVYVGSQKVPRVF